MALQKEAKWLGGGWRKMIEGEGMDSKLERILIQQVDLKSALNFKDYFL